MRVFNLLIICCALSLFSQNPGKDSLFSSSISSFSLLTTSKRVLYVNETFTKVREIFSDIFGHFFPVSLFKKL
ncbi:hypothetical protein KsCSTR_08050 [Candidatus Kuenenia stuttgartiensis]|uniref:Uncharacterized protein n=1 Tax=Kuenenia stuttgartiensis TaxID=174633 RepID=Q1PZC5_KUEST|nr:hypothetical protein KsCSTR_08050 [Candidatus Kuenenia stuttgartiensis]CAJ72440.1 unknown protein [Candidatus Kuenenia stuttgartiensis]